MRTSIPRYDTRDFHFTNYLTEFYLKKHIILTNAFFEIMDSMYLLDHSNTD